ncbi:hypothetical protein ACWIUD_01945 [Helicobacter sp. 23-1044]
MTRFWMVASLRSQILRIATNRFAILAMTELGQFAESTHPLTPSAREGE